MKDAISLPAVNRSFFSIAARLDGSCVRVILSGTADLRAQIDIETFFAGLSRETERVGAREIVIDLSPVEFMSSACFRQIVAWVWKAKEGAPSYRVCFVASPALEWHRRSMHALTCFASGFVSVRE